MVIDTKLKDGITYNIRGDFDEWIEEIQNRHSTDIITKIIVGV